jgi:hypothetical protein
MMKILIPSCSVQQQQKVVFVPNFWSLSHEMGFHLEPVFVMLLRNPGIDSQSGGPVRKPYSHDKHKCRHNGTLYERLIH